MSSIVFESRRRWWKYVQRGLSSGSAGCNGYCSKGQWLDSGWCSLSFLGLFMLDYLFAPTKEGVSSCPGNKMPLIYFSQLSAERVLRFGYLPLLVVGSKGTHYRLGKNLPGSGNLYRCSLSADTLQARKVTAAMTPPMIKVFPFQLCGCPYQPPAGDQTCLGYGTLPPPPIVASKEFWFR
jgi:hypothetical protein